MIFPFFLKFQQDKLNKRLHLVAEKHKQTNYQHVEGAGIQIKAAIIASDLHNSYAKSTKGLFKSFIPTTKEFHIRVICAKRLAETRIMLDEVEKAMSNAKLKPDHSRQIKKSLSDSEEVLQRKQYNRIFFGVRVVREAEDAQPGVTVFAQNNINPTDSIKTTNDKVRPFWVHNPRLII
jgi:peptidyl-tRNA hydrolase